MSRTKAVGECVSRPVPGRSTPACESAPPMTSIAGDTRLSASYVRASVATYAGAATSSPFGPNWGSQNRLRLGSLPTITCRRPGAPRASAATQSANCCCSAAASGVCELPDGYAAR